MKNTVTVNLPKRDSKGRFVKSVVKSAKVKDTLVRDNKGRFVAKNPSVLLRDNKGRFTQKTSKVNSATIKSSFIRSLTIHGNSVNVIMSRNPKVVYTYRPLPSGLKAVREALAKGTSLGSVFNEHLKVREISRTIYK